ncbi:MAG: DUF3106 domain-containing protein [Verrucomicrobia bacterium]|nr:DUF3106 domain-containing protein [Verrucomicrobiota bacterium]
MQRLFLLTALACATTLLGQPAPTAPTERGGLPAPPVPSLPTARTPVDFLRGLLAMTAADRLAIVTNRSSESRAFLEGKLKEFESLSPAAREARLQTLQLRWYLRPLMKVSAERRGPALATMPEADRKLVEERLAEWDTLPAEVQKQVLENETAMRLICRSETNAPPAEVAPAALTAAQQEQLEKDQTRWNTMSEEERQRLHAHFERFFELNEKEKARILNVMNETERRQMERTLAAFARLPEKQREVCLRNFQKFTALSPAERQEFLLNAERWRSMTAQDRQLWRDLVARLQPKPPLPPGFRKSPPLPPGAVPKSLAPKSATAQTN